MTAFTPDKIKEISLFGAVYPISSALLTTFGWLTFEPADTGAVDDYYAKAEARFIEQFKNKPNFAAIVKTFSAELDAVEDALNDLYTLRRLSTAFGVTLDKLGAIVGQARDGMDDDTYREAIRFKALINKSCGEPESLMSLAKALTDSTRVSIQEVYPAHVVLTVDGSAIDSQTVRVLKDIAVGGVSLELHSSYSADKVFAFAPDAGETPKSYHGGFSEKNYPAGDADAGALTEKLT